MFEWERSPGRWVVDPLELQRGSLFRRCWSNLSVSNGEAMPERMRMTLWRGPILLAFTLGAMAAGCERTPVKPAAATAAATTQAAAVQNHGPARAQGGAGAAGTAASSQPAGGRQAGPNVVVFLIDTLRADRIGAYGYTKRETAPTMDALARAGVVFEQAYSPSPWTAPTVAALFTSTFPNENNHIRFRSRLDDRFRTLAQRLGQVKYFTYGLSASAFVSKEFGLARGFAAFAAAPMIDGEKVENVFGVVYRAPFFFYIHNVEPHDPYFYAPAETPGFRTVSAERRAEIKESYSKYKAALGADKTDGVPTWSDAHDERVAACLRELDAQREDYSELYDATVRAADHNIASTIETLKRRGAWENTILVVTADHGEEMGEHGGWLHGQSVYEEQVRIPLIVRFPKDEFAGTRVGQPVSLVDLAPTILEWAGAPNATEGMRGRSLGPLIRGEAGAADEPVLVSVRHNMNEFYGVWHKQRGEINLAARLGKWKAIWNVEPQTLELYDVQADPGEKKNVAGDNAGVSERLRAFLVSAHEWGKANAAPIQVITPQSDTMKKLKTIGYVE